MSLGLWDYIKAAFNARPKGMFVPPNWVGLGAVGLLGLLNPGVWFIGAGLELAYLLGVSTSKRFQNFVDATQRLKGKEQLVDRRQRLIAQLSMDDRRGYELLEQRCQQILKQQDNLGEGEARTQSEGLGRLMWIYLQLLVSRQTMWRLVREQTAGDRESIEKRIRRLETQLEDEGVNAELRRSLEGQLDILRQRSKTQQEARENLAFVESELSRIREQIELIREQAALSHDPAILSERIDQVGGTLGETAQWMRDRQEVLGRLDALTEEAPPIELSSGQQQRVAE